MTRSTYRVHRMKTGLEVKQEALEEKLNGIEGDVTAIVPNLMQFPFARINYLLIVEKVTPTDT